MNICSADRLISGPRADNNQSAGWTWRCLQEGWRTTLMLSINWREVPVGDGATNQPLPGNPIVGLVRPRQSSDYCRKLLTLPHRTRVTRANGVAVRGRNLRHRLAMMAAVTPTAHRNRRRSRSRNHRNQEWPYDQKQNRDCCKLAHGLKAKRPLSVGPNHRAFSGQLVAELQKHPRKNAGQTGRIPTWGLRREYVSRRQSAIQQSGWAAPHHTG